MNIFDTLMAVVMGAVLVAAIAATWEIQDWRWKSKETSYVQEQLAEMQKEANKESKAANQFETKQEASNDTFQKIDKDLHSLPDKPPVVCFGSRRLHDVNSALARKAPGASGPSTTVSKPDTLSGK